MAPSNDIINGIVLVRCAVRIAVIVGVVIPSDVPARAIMHTTLIGIQIKFWNGAFVPVIGKLQHCHRYFDKSHSRYQYA